MPVLVQRDDAELRPTLARWLAGQMPGVADVGVSELSGPPATGFSNETLLFDATWSDAGEEHRAGLVARLAPTTHTVFPEPGFERQQVAMAALAPTDVPVPRLRWSEPDPAVLGAPFFVMDRLDGEIPGDNPPYTIDGWLLGRSPDEQRRVWETGLGAMAAVHALDWETAGLAALDDGPGPDRLGRQLESYARFLAWGAEGRPQSVAEAALAWLRAHLPAREGAPALCWGDSRIGNVIYQDHRAVAVLDWEMARIGDPVEDLAWYLWLDRHHSDGCGVARLPGFGGTDATVARWESATGGTAHDLECPLVVAGLRFAVIMCRLGRLMAGTGMLSADSDYDSNNTASGLLARELDARAAR